MEPSDSQVLPGALDASSPSLRENRENAPQVSRAVGPSSPALSNSKPLTPPEAGASISNSNAPLAAVIEPALRAACQQRLSAISWFRTDWQRGGALTGYATWLNDAQVAQPVVVKLPVPPCERDWLLRLQSADHLVPRVHAHGEAVGPYDMAWLIMERLPFGPLGSAWGGREFDLLIESVGRFYRCAASVPITARSAERNWERIFDQARQNVIKEHDLAHEQRWKAAMKKVHRKLKDWLKIWNDRPQEDWCHGDLHLGNAMSREPAPNGGAVLLDFALTHPGHWIEDAVYFEHLYWARRQKLGERRLCSLIAKQRRTLGLKVDGNWPRLASIKRALMAMSTPAQLDLDGDPHHVAAALEVLEIEAGA